MVTDTGLLSVRRTGCTGISLFARGYYIRCILTRLIGRHNEMRFAGTSLSVFPAAVSLVICIVLSANAQRIGGTLVVAVPVQDGLVTCSDKRLYNEFTHSFTDDFVKIHPAGTNALFVATHTTGFFDAKSGKMAFDVFDLTANYVSQRGFSSTDAFWDGLKKQIRDRLLAYLSQRKFADWPSTDLANNKLLFNLVFYAIDGRKARSYSISVFYEKAVTPVIFIPNVVREEVKTPKLLGKGKDVIGLLSRDPKLSRDPSILRFDQYNFDALRTTTADAGDFAGKLFLLANTRSPQAQVSKTYTCALLDYQDGFRWLN